MRVRPLHMRAHERLGRTFALLLFIPLGINMEQIEQHMPAPLRLQFMALTALCCMSSRIPGCGHMKIFHSRGLLATDFPETETVFFSSSRWPGSIKPHWPPPKTTPPPPWEFRDYAQKGSTRMKGYQRPQSCLSRSETSS